MKATKKKSLTQTFVDAAKDLGFEKATVDKLEELNIPDVEELSAKEIKHIRTKMKASQGVFARCLNVTPSTIQKWERGAVRPQAAALKLLNIVNERGPEILLKSSQASERKKRAA